MKVKALIEEALREMGVDGTLVELEVPRQKQHGDLSTPVAMSLARVLKKPPREIAETIAKKLMQTGIFEKVDVAGPGFVNLFYSKDFLFNELKALLSEPAGCLRKDIGQGKRVQVEFVSANPTGPLHLGHGRGAAVGAALSNLLERANYDVEREFYINDAGRQVHLLGESIYARLMELKGKDYPFPEDGYRGEYIIELAKRFLSVYGETIAERPFEEVKETFIEFGIQEMLKEIRDDLRDFGVEFDRWQSEKALYREGLVKNCLSELRQKDLLYEKDGALWFRAEAFGDEKDRVVIKSDGSYTYFASDIAYHWYKIQRGFDRLINIWGADHHGY
ncbi:MAG: arginine--tRNA ligase, partial [Nitrospirae bacterium]